MPVNIDVAMDAAHKIYDRLIKLGRSDVEARRDAESWVRTTWGITIQLPMPAPAPVRRRGVRRVRPPSAPPPPPAGRSGQDGANLCIKCRVRPGIGTLAPILYQVLLCPSAEGLPDVRG